jgi:hypothetical protein
MIPYTICNAAAIEDARDNNIFITNGSCKKEEINSCIISFIIEFMDEFCSEKYGHGITISSYDNFCEQYWILQGFQIRGWFLIFRIKYFINNKWKLWNIEDNVELIFTEYKKKYTI